jgi:adenine-specific DNA-methyltransferase
MPISALLSLREDARKLAERRHHSLPFVRSFIAAAINNFFPGVFIPVEVSDNLIAQKIGIAARDVDIETALYVISTVYTVMLPKDYRTHYGVFYTPPILTKRLLDLAEQGGINWGSSKVLDPACGGGAFLAPVATRMAKSLASMNSEDRIKHIEANLKGFEIDSFAAWMSQAFVEIVLAKDLQALGRQLEALVSIRDSLQVPKGEYNQYDLVIGNPPYGRIKLPAVEREKWTRSLYGHANLYGLFADLAVRLAKPEGMIAYVTPASFLGGQYFKNLRTLLATESPLIALDFVNSRQGVFTDVLQEAVLTVYRRGADNPKVSVSFLCVKETGVASVESGGEHHLLIADGEPWILPRSSSQVDLISHVACMPHRLYDLGYEVSTGPLVWNRHKDRLHNNPSPGVVPLIWAESVDPAGSGRFSFKADARNHMLWYKPYDRNDSNIINQACVLLQRTTALEQHRRLIAAELEQQFINQHGGCVTVENHLNMIHPIPERRLVITTKALARLLNSEIVDQIFRCINGSTAVSAYELESLPLPSPKKLQQIDRMLARGAHYDAIEKAIREMYLNVR